MPAVVNPHTQITTVLNRLSFKPGDIVDTREFAASERRLKAAQLYKVEPMKGIEPKIAYSPPESEDRDTMVAGKRRTSYYRVPGGEAPLPPGEGYLDVDVSTEGQDPASPSAQSATYAPAAYPRPRSRARPSNSRPRSGKHVLSFNLKAGYSGDNTPIYERFYAGGFSSIRGFAFRGVTPRDPVYGMGVGGDFQMTSTLQYLFPITADDMLRGVVFVDAGTVQPRLSDWVDKVRLAPGFGLRISIPMMGLAPIALDFAFPILQQNGDQTQIFSFFVGFNH